MFTSRQLVLTCLILATVLYGHVKSQPSSAPTPSLVCGEFSQKSPVFIEPAVVGLPRRLYACRSSSLGNISYGQYRRYWHRMMWNIVLPVNQARQQGQALIWNATIVFDKRVQIGRVTGSYHLRDPNNLYTNTHHFEGTAQFQTAVSYNAPLVEFSFEFFSDQLAAVSSERTQPYVRAVVVGCGGCRDTFQLRPAPPTTPTIFRASVPFNGIPTRHPIDPSIPNFDQGISDNADLNHRGGDHPQAHSVDQPDDATTAIVVGVVLSVVALIGLVIAILYCRYRRLQVQEQKNMLNMVHATRDNRSAQQISTVDRLRPPTFRPVSAKPEKVYDPNELSLTSSRKYDPWGLPDNDAMIQSSAGQHHGLVGAKQSTGRTTDSDFSEGHRSEVEEFESFTVHAPPRRRTETCSQQTRPVRRVDAIQRMSADEGSNATTEQKTPLSAAKSQSLSRRLVVSTASSPTEATTLDQEGYIVPVTPGKKSLKSSPSKTSTATLKNSRKNTLSTPSRAPPPPPTEPPPTLSRQSVPLTPSKSFSSPSRGSQSQLLQGWNNVDEYQEPLDANYENTEFHGQYEEQEEVAEEKDGELYQQPQDTLKRGQKFLHLGELTAAHEQRIRPRSDGAIYSPPATFKRPRSSTRPDNPYDDIIVSHGDITPTKMHVLRGRLAFTDDMIYDDVDSDNEVYSTHWSEQGIKPATGPGGQPETYVALPTNRLSHIRRNGRQLTAMQHMTSLMNRLSHRRRLPPKPRPGA